VIGGLNCQPAAQVKVVAGMIETLRGTRKLLIAAVEIAFGLALLVLGFVVLTAPPIHNPGKWMLLGAGLLVGGVIVTFYSIRKFWAILEVDFGLALPQPKLPRLTFRRKRKLLEPYEDETFAAMIAAIENPPTITVYLARQNTVAALMPVSLVARISCVNSTFGQQPHRRRHWVGGGCRFHWPQQRL